MKLSKILLSLLLCAVMVLGSVVIGGNGFAEVLDAFSVKASAAKVTSYKTGDIIEFGWYPQTKETNSSIIASLNAASGEWISYNYYSGTGSRDDGQMKPSDYMRYKDVYYNNFKYRAVIFDNYRPSDTGDCSFAGASYQDDNGYTTGNVYWFKYEPIKWRVLDPTTGLVMCETVIDAQTYNNYVQNKGYETYHVYYGDSLCSYYASNYANSSIRHWLNNDFYDTAFSSEQKSNIIATTLDNSAINSSGYDAPATTDKIFLLSYYDTINSNYGFNSSGSYYDVKRQLKSTDYAECQGSYRSTFPHYDWALRTPYDSHYSCFVHPYGSSTSVGPVNEISGIVPAMYLIDNQVEHPEDFIYRIENNEIIIIYYKGNDTEVIIPNHIEGYPVTTLSTSAFGGSPNPEEYDNTENIEKINTIVIPNTVTKIQNNSFVKCKGLSHIYYRGSSSEWNKAIKDYQRQSQNSEFQYLEKATFHFTNYSNPNLLFIDDFNFIQDTYNFMNPTSSIPYDFYVKMYGSSVATNMQTWFDKGTGGQCYGMATTNAFFIEHGLKDGLPERMNESFINQITVNSYVNFGNYYNVSQLIKYAYLLQYCPQLQDQLGKTENKYQDLFLAVNAYFNGGTPIVINIKKNVPKPLGWGHTVLPIGIEKVSDGFDIYLADSANYQELEDSIIHLDGSDTNITGWSYIVDGNKSLSSNDFGASISFSSPLDLLEYFSEHGTLQGNNTDTDSYAMFKYYGSTTTKVGDTIINKSVNNGYTEKTYIPIFSYGSDTNSVDTENVWINTAKGTISFEDIEQDNEFHISSGNYSIDFSVSKNDTATISIDEAKRKTLIIDTTAGNIFRFVSYYYDNDGTEKTKEIIGVANSNQVVLTQNENNLVVTGADITEVAKVSIKNCKNITVDYKSSVKLNAICDESSTSISWFDANTDIKITDGNTYIVDVATKSFSVYAAVVVDGIKIDGTESEIETVTVKTGFFDKLIAFFRSFFRILPVWVDNVKQ